MPLRPDRESRSWWRTGLFASFEMSTGGRSISSTGTNAAAPHNPFQNWRRFKELANLRGRLFRQIVLGVLLVVPYLARLVTSQPAGRVVNRLRLRLSARRNRTAKACAVRLSQTLSQSNPPSVTESVTTSKGQGQGIAATGPGASRHGDRRARARSRRHRCCRLDTGLYADRRLACGRLRARCGHLPTVASVASRPCYTPPRSLEVFSEAIAEARRKRTADVPAALRRDGPRFPDKVVNRLRPQFPYIAAAP
jgi:hypothetical protein